MHVTGTAPALMRHLPCLDANAFENLHRLNSVLFGPNIRSNILRYIENKKSEFEADVSHKQETDHGRLGASSIATIVSTKWERTLGSTHMLFSVFGLSRRFSRTDSTAPK